MKKKHILIFLTFLLIVFISHNIFAVENEAQQAKIYIFYQPEANQEMYLFMNEQFLSLFKKDTYLLVNRNPGINTLWFSDGEKGYVLNEFEFIPGQTYYINIGYNGYHSLLNPVDGAQLLQKGLTPSSTDEKTEKLASDMLKKISLNKEAKLESFINKPKIVSNNLTDLKLPQFTPIKLSFIDNIFSDINKTNVSTRLKVVEDVMINGKVCIPKGTVVNGVNWNIVPAHGHGNPGFIDIVIPEIKLQEDMNVPIIGRYIKSGDSRAYKATHSYLEAHSTYTTPSTGLAGSFLTAVLEGIFKGAMSSSIEATVKGTEAIIPKGEEVIVLTRYEMGLKPWVGPLPTNNFSEDNVVERIKTKIPQEVVFPTIYGPPSVDFDRAYDMLFKQINKYKIGNVITLQDFKEFKAALYHKPDQNKKSILSDAMIGQNPDLQKTSISEDPALTCAKETGGYYLTVTLDIAANQIDRGYITLYDSDYHVICSVITKGGLIDSTKELIEFGTEALAAELKKVKPSIIKE